MPYKRKAPAAKKRSTMPKRRQQYRKKQYRKAFANTLQIANLRPATVMVKFQAKQRYLLTSTSPVVASNSILQWNGSSGLKNPTVVSGNWTAQRSGDLFNSQDYQPYFDRYNTYKVLGSKMSATVRPNPLDGLDTQVANLVTAIRSTNSSQFSSTTPYYDIESAFGSKSRAWGTLSGSGYKSASIMQGYSPKKQLNIKDVRDNDELDVQTTAYGNNPAESTFQHIIVRPCIVTASQGHMTCIVDVLFDVLAMFQDSSTNNAPLPN